MTLGVQNERWAVSFVCAGTSRREGNYAPQLPCLTATSAPSSLLALHLSFPPGAAWSGTGRTWTWDWRRPATVSGTAPSAGPGLRSCRITSSQQPAGAPVLDAGALPEQSSRRPSEKVGVGEL